MKTILGFYIVFVLMLCFPSSIKAQDVYIPVPETNIFNRTELNTMKSILNTGSSTTWRNILAIPTDPTIRSNSGLYFIHTTVPSCTLPTSILPWRLNNIGGSLPPFNRRDDWPGYKWFTNNDQTWYQPRFAGSSSGYNAGDVVFNFKIPAISFLENAFYPGDYQLSVTHNYHGGGYAVSFTPTNLNIILTIPAAIQWLSNTSTKYVEINDLNAYRSTATHVLGNLGNATLGNTVDFNLLAKASSSSIQFTSSKNVQGTRDISNIKLGSSSPNLTILPLSANNQTFSTSNFIVETGNRNNFTLELSIDPIDFKTHFYQAGTYTFQLNLDAKGTDNSISSLQNTDVTLKVLPLSEITIPTSGNAVNFEFNTNTHYQQGLSKLIPNQIKISNNETFELYVKSDTQHFKKGGIQTDVNSNILEIGIDGSNQVALSTISQKIISAGIPVLDQELNIKYTIPPTAAQSLVGREKTTYSINVIYSFTAL